MPDTEELFKYLDKSPIAYFYTDPPIDDFTKKFQGDFCFSNGTSVFRVSAKDSISFKRLDAAIRRELFAKKTVFTYDIKKYCSYALYHNEIPFDIQTIDIKYLNHYFAVKSKPLTLREAVNVDLIEKYKKINEVYSPLSTKVIPFLENREFIDDTPPAKYKHTTYDIEAQANGRMSCHKIADNYLNIHTLSSAEKSKIRLKPDADKDDVFLILDFMQMEVEMLSWLTGDANLKEILRSGKDFYSSFGLNRDIGKALFLPTVYGMQPSTLAARFKIEVGVAEKLIKTIKEQFKTAFDWLTEKQEALKDNPIAEDYHGRLRDFSNEPHYKRLNSEVQSPASLFCLMKLNFLFDKLQEYLWFSLHDGFGLYCNIKDLKNIIKEGKEVLEREEDLFPGLKIKVSVKVGHNLADTISI